ncbi:MAG: nucleotide sugar dehydrogenase [Euryarchaeota archaeon]|nr:nucleotide sugar dehydrogenase [Euryarchaeota archaeon]MBU4608452.1 nucleotide sugar dehydrogenase [Euryarchaeota archaeon]MBV1729653.1 nucleotide sugar dehydrogenase [Methanobacterium sp.]MBV1754839.1 nucleotide sugar dehydrogenase [Methanobacterium sp.]
MKNRIVLFGLGYIGLPTASLFAKNGFQVTGVDINSKIVDKINSGISPIMEPGLKEVVKEVVSNGNLKATLDGIQAVKKANIIIVVVPTPVDQNKCANLLAVISACETISQGLKSGDLVVIESTVPPGTCENIVIPILEKSGLKASQDFGVAYTPERALPNNTLYEMTHNARVIGGIDKESAKKAASLYQKITVGEVIIVNNLVTAEMVKLMENTYRDTNIALANELAMVCESLGIDAIDAIKAANFHPRVNIHTPGPGVGGHCLSIDPYFIVEIAEQNGKPAKLIQMARDINNYMPYHVVKSVEEEITKMGKSFSGSKIAVLGVAYKGNVADTRESPSLTIINDLVNKGAAVFAHDPHVPEEIIISAGAQPIEMQDALCCDCVVLMTDHDVYKEISPKMVKSPIFICTRPILNPDDFKNNEIIFRGIGRVF